MHLSFQNVTFRYENAVDPLFDDIDIHFSAGWTGIVGANGTGKSTLLRLACGELEPETGKIRRPDTIIYCQQRTDTPPPLLQSLIDSTDAEACELRGKLEIDSEWQDRWETLSHGERKRAQIGVALWQSPDVLAVDEPTNHIDANARNLLQQALKSFKGIGLLVSHDRELLDSLCRQCLFIEPPTVTMRSGGYTEAAEQARVEEEHIREEYEEAKQSAEQLQKEAIRRRQEAAKSKKMRSKRGLDIKDHDARFQRNRARYSGKDGKAGRLASQMDGRVQQAESRLAEFELKRKYDLSFWVPGSASKRNMLFSIPPGIIPLGGGRSLTFPELTMAPDDRIAITGPNGSGKSTLIRHILDSLTLPEDKVIYLPQEIDENTSRKIMAEIINMPKNRLGVVMTVVSCLGSRPERLVRNTDVSPGEIRKVMLALGISKEPHLIIMDEPTNHLDLPAIELLEQALEGCPCGLLLVSHDYRFLSKLAGLRWHISPTSVSGDTLLRLTGIEEPADMDLKE